MLFWNVKIGTRLTILPPRCYNVPDVNNVHTGG